MRINVRAIGKRRRVDNFHEAVAPQIVLLEVYVGDVGAVHIDWGDVQLGHEAVLRLLLYRAWRRFVNLHNLP